MTLSVIGAGFGRTGTLSLKLALEKLGLGPCYHMIEVFRRPEHATLWSDAAEGKAMDWDALFEGYGAAVDWPVCYFWRELCDHYRDARVLLTVRDPERWYQSAHDTIFQAMSGDYLVDTPEGRSLSDMAEAIVIERTFGGKLEDRAHAIAVYERHCAQVQAEIPADRLLVYRVGEGWGPLCRFLGQGEPQEPFPHVNSTADYQARLARARG